MKEDTCKLCKFRVECLETPGKCSITSIDDDVEWEDAPHPSEIEFDLRASFAKFVGNQLYIWVDAKTIRAIASMRNMEISDQTQGYDIFVAAYLDSSLNPNHDISICFIPDLPEESDRRDFRATVYCINCSSRISITRPDNTNHPCPNCHTTLPIQRRLF